LQIVNHRLIHGGGVPATANTMKTINPTRALIMNSFERIISKSVLDLLHAQTVIQTESRIHLSSMSTASNRLVPTFLIKWVTAPARQRTSAIATLRRSAVAFPSVEISISPGVIMTASPGNG